MSIPIRAPMPHPPHWIGEDDISLGLSAKGPTYGRRFTMDINEEMFLRGIAARAMEHATEHLATHVVHEHREQISSAVATLLSDAEWAKPIIEREIRAIVEREIRCAVRELIAVLFTETRGPTEEGA